MSNYCEDCGSRVYNGHCTWCHEETYIAQQNYENDEPIEFSHEFQLKLAEQRNKADEILIKQKYKIQEVD